MNAVAYARFSSDEQRQESITAQVRAIKYYASSYGYDVIHVYADEAKSGRSDKRPQFLKMIEDSKAGKFQAVIVHKYDRFSRSAEDTLFYERTLRLNGAQVISVIEALDSSPEGQLMKQIILGMNQFYSANLAREVMKGLKENAYQGIHTGGVPPLGYDICQDRHYAINDREAEAVRTIFQMYAKGCGYGEIISALNAGGYKTKTGKFFGKNSLYEIMKNEKYTGVYIFNKSSSRGLKGTHNRHKYKNEAEIIRIEGGMPAIIDRKLFEEVSRKMEANKQQNAKHKARVMYLLTGKLFCGYCGHAMTGETRRYKGLEYSYYVCSYRKTTKNCNKKTIRKEILEEAILQELNDKIFNTKNIEAICKRIYESYQDDSAEQKIKAMKNECLKIDSKVKNLHKAIEEGLHTGETLKRINELVEDKNRLLISLWEMESVSNAKLKSIEEIKQAFMLNADIKALSPIDQRAVIQRFVDAIYLYDDDGGGYRIRIVVNPNRDKALSFLDTVGVSLPLPPVSKNNILFFNGLLILDIFLFTLKRRNYDV